eukprot:scaffold91903_cov58-Phaeocystis_antarctica.AAC.1
MVEGSRILRQCWTPSGPASRPGCFEPHGAARRALRRRRSRVRALQRQHFDRAAAPTSQTRAAARECRRRAAAAAEPWIPERVPATGSSRGEPWLVELTLAWIGTAAEVSSWQGPLELQV